MRGGDQLEFYCSTLGKMLEFAEPRCAQSL